MPYMILDPLSSVRVTPDPGRGTSFFRIVWSGDVAEFNRLAADERNAPPVPVYAFTPDERWAQEMIDAVNVMNDPRDLESMERTIVNGAPVVKCTISEIGRGLMHPTEFLYRIAHSGYTPSHIALYSVFPGSSTRDPLATVYDFARQVMPNCNCAFCVRSRGNRIEESSIPQYLSREAMNALTETNYPWQNADVIQVDFNHEVARLAVRDAQRDLNEERARRDAQLTSAAAMGQEQINAIHDSRTIMPQVLEDFSERPMPERISDEPTKEDRVAALRALLGKIDELIPTEKDRTARPNADNPQEARDLEDTPDHLSGSIDPDDCGAY